MSEFPTLALSLTQPWAWFMLELPPEHRKDVENRSWNTNVRGDVWVHASKRMTADDYAGALDTAAEILGHIPKAPPFHEVKRGGIVGRFKIIGVERPRVSSSLGHRHRWHFADSFGFVVTDARPVPFVPCSGALGFCRVPPAVLEQLRSQE
jgi:hypothetical protein